MPQGIRYIFLLNIFWNYSKAFSISVPSAVSFHCPLLFLPYKSFQIAEPDTTERLHFHFSLSCTGEGNGNPLQCSCLENPRDEGAWWAAIYGVAQSWTRLKRLSSSSIMSYSWNHVVYSLFRLSSFI